MPNKKFVLAIITFLIVGNSMAQHCTNNARYSEIRYFDSTELTAGMNVQYGTALDFQNNPYPLKMDLYYPNLTADTVAKRPFVMLFHGGGFSSGDKQSGDIRDLCIHLALRGFVCATVNYRLGHDFSEYGQYKARYRAIQDGHAALRYIVNNANAVRIDTGWLFVGGQSAGSLLALGMVYADPSELDSISLLYGKTAISSELGNLFKSGNSLTNTYSIKGIFNNWGGITQSEVDVTEMIPTVAFHGELDTTVRIDADKTFKHYTLNGSRAIHNDLVANQICSEITIDTMGEHGIFRNASALFRAQRASCFFKSIFCKQCSNFYSTDSIPTMCLTTLGILKNDLNPNITIHPNPFENSFRIEGIEGIWNLTLYNGCGQVMHNGEITNGEFEADLIPGIYFLNLHHVQSNQSFKTKLIKN
jgi:poly(3-hydroxybutyrate) depolymerase